MTKQGQPTWQTLLLMALTTACVWTAGVVLDLPWLTQPWYRMWARVAMLWS